MVWPTAEAAPSIGGFRERKSAYLYSMNAKELKLKIIELVTNCEDHNLLKVIHQMLDSLGNSHAKPTEDHVSTSDLHHILLQSPKEFQTSEGASAEEISDLQASIDEIFGKTE